ncbi:MAG: hypothetical protein JNJ54_00560 [Myxococcaceae bacterium]|nr:hypothetical protein [Myxococcaceae bacterium]
MALEPVVTELYEVDGFFDKDAQGWCATVIDIRQDGGRVSVREAFLENGSLRTEATKHGTVGQVEGDRVPLRFEDGSVAWFDLKTRRLER